MIRENQKFYAKVDGKEARLKYKMKDDNVIDFKSTFVPDEARGKQIAAQIVEAGLDYARENDLTIIPTCPFVEKFIDSNEQFKDLILESMRG